MHCSQTLWLQECLPSHCPALALQAGVLDSVEEHGQMARMHKLRLGLTATVKDRSNATTSSVTKFPTDTVSCNWMGLLVVGRHVEPMEWSGQETQDGPLPYLPPAPPHAAARLRRRGPALPAVGAGLHGNWVRPLLRPDARCVRALMARTAATLCTADTLSPSDQPTTLAHRLLACSAGR